MIKSVTVITTPYVKAVDIVGHDFRIKHRLDPVRPPVDDLRCEAKELRRDAEANLQLASRLDAAADFLEQNPESAK